MNFAHPDSTYDSAQEHVKAQRSKYSIKFGENPNGAGIGMHKSQWDKLMDAHKKSGNYPLLDVLEK